MLTKKMGCRGGIVARIAVLLHGGLENVDRGRCIPVLVDWVERVSRLAELEIFSLRGSATAKDTTTLGKARITYLGVKTGSGYWSTMRAFRRALSARHQQRPFDLVHGIWGLPGGLAAVLLGRRFKLPALVSLQGAETAGLPDLGYGAQCSLKNRMLLRWLCRRADGITALTGFQAELLFQQTGCHARVQPYGVDLDQFPFRERQPRPPYQFLHVAHQNAVKDQRMLLHAFTSLVAETPSHLTLVGGDYMGGAIRRQVEAMGLASRVTLAGEVAHEELPLYYGKADGLLHSSRYEAQAVVVAEALASGLPVCGTRVGLIADLDGEATSAVPVADAPALARAALTMMRDDALRRRMVARGVSWARAHSAAHTAEGFAEIYRALITRKKEGI